MHWYNYIVGAVIFVLALRWFLQIITYDGWLR
jgi:hypothetical protein